MSFDPTFRGIECQVCHKMSFDPDAKYCVSEPVGNGQMKGCGWPLRDDPEEHAKAYGFDAMVEFRAAGTERVLKVMHRKGKASRVKAAARAKAGRVLALKPLTYQQFVAGYGEGHEGC